MLRTISVQFRRPLEGCHRRCNVRAYLNYELALVRGACLLRSIFHTQAVPHIQRPVSFIFALFHFISFAFSCYVSIENVVSVLFKDAPRSKDLAEVVPRLWLNISKLLLAFSRCIWMSRLCLFVPYGRRALRGEWGGWGARR